MGLCLDLGAVLEGHPDVVLAVNGDVSKAIDALMVLVLSSFTHFAGFISAGIIS